MVNGKIYSNKAFAQLLSANDKFCYTIATAKSWEQVVKCIDKLITYNQDQLEYVKQVKWINK